MIRIELDDEVAHLVYDELQGRLEYLGMEAGYDSAIVQDSEIHRRVYRSLEAALEALDVAGSGPSPMGTYR